MGYFLASNPPILAPSKAMTLMEQIYSKEFQNLIQKQLEEKIFGAIQASSMIPPFEGPVIGFVDQPEIQEK